MSVASEACFSSGSSAPLITHGSFFIGGSWIKPAGSRVPEVISPITEEVFGQLPEATNADMDQAVAAARRAFDYGSWPKMSIDRRCEYMARLAQHLEPMIPAAIDLQINEMGGARKFIGPATHACLGSRIHDGIRIAKTMSLREVRDGVFGKVVVTRQSIGVV